jgi:hypothetical protein
MDCAILEIMLKNCNFLAACHLRRAINEICNREYEDVQLLGAGADINSATPKHCTAYDTS